ncbi:MAG: primosomal protein N' [Dehalococcoidia bacterium]|nr:primosomal protein N' [Dehalococcoidia bacterium]
MRYAEIAVDAPTGRSQTFSYHIPEDMALTPGQLVRVPFGVRALQGVVFELASSPQVEETRPVSRTLSDVPVLESHQLSLARWISDYYMCSLFEAAAPMFPPGARVGTRTILSVNPEYAAPEGAALNELQSKVIEIVRGQDSVDIERLVSRLGERARRTVSSLVRRDVLIRSSQTSRTAIGPRYEEQLRVNENALEEIARWLSAEGKRAWRQSELITRLAESNESVVASEVRREFGSTIVKTLVNRGWLETEKTQVFRDPLADRVFEREALVSLSPRQSAVAEDVIKTVRDSNRLPRTILVQGVTGSGKTEIYLSAVEECLALGRQAVVMAPEISLTPQTIERFAGRFPGRVAVLHSGLSDGQRYDQWWAIREGRYPIVVGSRSAVFAPLSNPGLVILDEEHEWTYKQTDASPRYHARDVAIRLGRMTGAVTLLGSASPDVSSYYRGVRGEYRLHSLPDRLNRRRDGSVKVAPLPVVEIVDMRDELREGNTGIFSRKLESEIESCLQDGRQAILFLNRRGTASQMQCRSCGYRISCRSCDVPLTYHRAMQRLLCHYCGRRYRMARSCPECLGYRLSFYGIGTQSVADEVERLFPGARILRWDRDATRYPREYEAALSSFRNGEADVLIGTQMIAKGLHLPGVTLVGVALADVGLSIPDFKSSERTFQLLCQVAGRAGRGEETGRVIFQTYQPENYSIEKAAAQDYEGFYQAEMRYRREHNNPPFSRLIRLVHSHTNNATCESRAARLAEELRSVQRESDMANVEILGPTPPYPPRLRGRYRWHIVLRGREPRTLLDMVAIPQGWSVDVDPVTLT